MDYHRMSNRELPIEVLLELRKKAVNLGEQFASQLVRGFYFCFRKDLLISLYTKVSFI